MLTRHGIADTDVTVHSHFLSYLAALGDTFGYSGVFECPIPTTPASNVQRLGEVRPDTVWFTKADNQPVAAFEFERFGPGQETKLRNKMENLPHCVATERTSTTSNRANLLGAQRRRSDCTPRSRHRISHRLCAAWGAN